MTSRHHREGEYVRLGVWRVATIILLALILLWLSVGLTVSLVLGRHQSGYALRLWPNGAEAAARRSAELLLTQREITAAKKLAVSALTKEPANAAAARDLGLVYSYQGKAKESEAAFLYAERMSRRDLPTQMGLIESRVQAEDIPGALLHYDRAMRSSLESRKTLIPILVTAAQDPAAVDKIIKVLITRPNWRSEFIDALVGQSPGANAMGKILSALQLDPADPTQARQLGIGLRHMVDLGAIPEAYALYRQVRKFSPSNVPLLRGGDFETAGPLMPFEWQLADGTDRQGVREAREGAQGQFALSLYGDSAGEIARQLMVLPPGNYRLSGLAGGVSADGGRPTIAIICAKDAVVLANVALPTGSSRRTFGGTLKIPASCPSQWMFISIAGSLDRQNEAPWIDAIQVRPDRSVSVR